MIVVYFFVCTSCKYQRRTTLFVETDHTCPCANKPTIHSVCVRKFFCFCFFSMDNTPELWFKGLLKTSFGQRVAETEI